MIDFDIDGVVRRAGGRFKMVSLVQRRMRELQRGAQPLVEPRGSSLEIALRELEEGKIWLALGEEAEKLREERAPGGPPRPPALPKPGKGG